MNLRVKPLIVLLPLLIFLAIGWFFIVIGFGRIHQVFYVDFFEQFRQLRPKSDLYAVQYLQFWTFVFGVPAFAVFAVLHGISDNFILGIIQRTILCACAVALGGCFCETTTIFAVSQDDSRIPERDFFILNLIGQLMSLITFFILYGLSPWLIETFAKDNVKDNNKLWQ